MRKGEPNSGGLRAYLLRGAAGSIAVSVGAKALLLSSAVVLARVLGPSGYGLFSFAVSVATLLTFPAELGMNQLVTRELASAVALGRWDLVRGLLRRAVQFRSLSTCLVLALSFSYLWLAGSALSLEARLTLTVAMGLTAVNAWGGWLRRA